MRWRKWLFLNYLKSLDWDFIIITALVSWLFFEALLLYERWEKRYKMLEQRMEEILNEIRALRKKIEGK
jgi:hypothetical protein